MHKMRRIRSSCACIKYHPGLCSTFIHYVVSMILLGDTEGFDQTARMRRLILGFVVRIYPETLFRMAQPIFALNIWLEKPENTVLTQIILSVSALFAIHLALLDTI